MILGKDGLWPIALSTAEPQVFSGRPPLDRFSTLKQEESYSGSPPPAEAKSSPYKDEQEASSRVRSLPALCTTW